MAAAHRSGSSRIRSSIRLASVGSMRAYSMPCSSSSSRRGPASRNAGGQSMPRPMISRWDLPSGLPTRKYSSWAPGRPTRSNVGFGM